jgi:catechol 2,3-dioxygenase-like lactoylglutathione lyase family enzyme
MRFAVQGIDHVEVFVSDIAAAAKWYKDVLGLKEMARWEPEPMMIGVGATKLALFRRNSPRTANAASLEISEGWRRVAWLTDAVGFDAAQKHLVALGIRFAGPQDHGRSRSIYFTDPDGNPLEITFYV